MALASNEIVSRFSGKVAASSQDLFPVVEVGTRRLMGVFSKSDLVDPPRTSLSLVDHNEFSQAVNGVEEAKVIEIIDHHRLSGDLVTRDPPFDLSMNQSGVLPRLWQEDFVKGG